MTIGELIKDLNTQERSVLYFHAMDGGENSNLFLSAFMDVFGLQRREYDKVVKSLLKKNILVDYGYYWRYNQIREMYRVPALLYLIQNDKRIESTLYDNVFKGNKSATRLYRILKYAYSENAASSPLTEKMGQDEAEALRPYAAMPWIDRALEFLDDNAFLWFVNNVLSEAEVSGDVIPRTTIDRLCSVKGQPNEVIAKLKDRQLYYEYIAHGIYDPEKMKRAAGPWAITVRAIRATLRGEYEQALEYFSLAFKTLNRNNRVKNMYELPIPQYYLVMTHVHLDNETSKTKLTQFLNKKPTENYPCLLPAAYMAKVYLNSKRVCEEYNITELLSAKRNNMPLMNLRFFGTLFDRYYGTGLYNGTILIPEYPIMRNELSEYLPINTDERQALAETYGDKPALTSIYLKRDWELVMEDILKTVEQESPVAKLSNPTTQSSRIIYVRSYRDHFDPKCQVTLKSGGWSKPKNVSLPKFYDGELEYMTDVDRTIGQTIRPTYYSYDSDSNMAPLIMPYLVGSDRVFYGEGYRNDILSPITVEREEPYLRVSQRKDGSGFDVSSNVKLEALKKTVNGCITIPVPPDKYVVIPLPDNQRKIYEKLLAYRSYPSEAKTQLQKFLTHLDGVIEVKSPLIDKSAIKTIDGGTMIAVKVVPAAGYNYNLGLFAKPVAEGNTYCIPGTGNKVVYDTVQGEYTRVKRNLKEETQNYREVIDAIDSTDSPVSEDDNTPTVGIDQVLDLLAYTQQHPDKALIEWPEGKAVSLKAPLSQGTWNVGLKADKGWFDIEGDVRIDDHTVIKMTQLLELIAQDKGRFVRLNENDFVEIDKKLRRQLERIEALAVKNRNKMQISSFNAGLLDDKTLDGAVKIDFDDTLVQLRQRIKDSEGQSPRVPKTLQATLRPYQVDGYQWMMRLASWGAGACLADDMGLGKTVQTIAFLLAKASEGPALIVAPASVVPNWRNELERFAPSLNVEILNKAEDRTQCVNKAKKSDIILTTYGLLNTEEESLSAKKWATVVLDEAHTIKNRETKMSQAAMKLNADYRIALTGTPIQNHLGELWNLFRFINPGLLGTFDMFRHKFVTPIVQDNDAERRRALQRILKPFMLRRTKAEVIDDLPDKTDIILPVELSDEEMAMYEALRKKAVAALEEATTLDVNTLAEITKLRRAACAVSLIDKDWTGTNSKVQTFLELVRDFKGDNNRMLVFSQFTSFLDIVRKALDQAGEKYLYLDGSTSMKQREKLVEEFNQGECPLFLISLKAGGLGLNLTAANYVVHLDPWWNPAIEQQATDRSYRIGQQRNVTVYHLLSKNTIEEKIRRLHQTKRDLSDSLLEGADMASRLTVKDVMEMIADK